MTAPAASPDQLNGHQSPPPSPFGIGFRQPTPEAETLPPLPHPAESPEGETLPPLAGELGSAPDESSDESEPPAATSSRASTRVGNPLVGPGLRDAFRNGVIIASHQAHTYLGSRTEGQAAVQLYLADQEDAERIGDPLSRIAARRDGVGEMNPDTADLLAAMMGLAGYASKQIQKAAVASKIDARDGGLHTVPAGDQAVDL